jgi:multicomponent Na+:H+ antiporter subunit E
LRVARDVVTRKTYRRPGIVAVPLDAKTDAEITVLALFISLTPGTLAIDVSDDRKVLYVHEMFITDPEEVRRQLKAGFERYVLALLR